MYTVYMQYILHKAQERGKAEHGWLHSRFSFSFAHWYDPKRMGFGALRVINDDIIDPDSGFDMHPHNNMEIITIVMEGAITHEDSMGNIQGVPAGDIQVMSAGTGVTHSEYNTSLAETLKLFQIWIYPKSRDIVPRYDQKSFGNWESNALRLLVSPDGREQSLLIHQDAFISRASFDAGKTHTYAFNIKTNGVYIFVIKGSIVVNEYTLDERDALGVYEVSEIQIVAKTHTQYLIFEVPLMF